MSLDPFIACAACPQDPPNQVPRDQGVPATWATVPGGAVICEECQERIEAKGEDAA